MGNKYNLLSQMLPYFPKNINRFYDVFGGSGVVSLNVKANEYHINDLSNHVYNLYKLFKETSSDKIIQYCYENRDKWGFSSDETVKKEINRLAKVGVKVWWTAHVKEKDQVDLFTGTQYTTLTANMSMKYFNAIKNSSHIVAFGYFDRSIEKQAVGEVNPITKKAKERKSVLAEARKPKSQEGGRK